MSEPKKSKLDVAALSDDIDTANRSLTTPVRDTILRFRLFILVIVHAGIFALIYWVAFLMRFTLDVPEHYAQIYRQGVMLLIATKLIIFYSMRSFHGWWRHVNFSDLISLSRSAAVASLALIAIDYFVLQTWQEQIPRTVILNDFVLTIVVLGGMRSVWRVWDERIVPLDRRRGAERGLMIGRDVSAARLAHLINGQHRMGVRIVGLVSPGEFPKGQRFSDLRIVGRLENISRLMKLHRANKLFVITGTIPPRELRDLLDSASDLQYQIRILPPLEDQLAGLDRVPIREVSYDDLLRRKTVQLDQDSIKQSIVGKTVLVTGAGGSIGAELCRQLALFSPSRLILLGRGENRIYHIERELAKAFPAIDLIPRIVNITDQSRIEETFRELKPDLVFHAAAHKHVPLVEQNVGESIINNVHGTRIVANAADRFGVERFVMISTDKAVNPTSVMGCTKHMAERYCQALSSNSNTKFISTRFGNVLGSAGSVVPLFQEQIRSGGPITLTDKRMTRYFMTIPEASQLVIQAATMGQGGEIFVLEMGEPVKILDLAKDLIRLAGHAPEAIDIVETGVRPGEKLYEELYYENEESLPTSHEKILSSCSRAFSIEEVRQQVDDLVSVAFDEPAKIRAMLGNMIVDFSDDQNDSPQPPK